MTSTPHGALAKFLLEGVEGQPHPVENESVSSETFLRTEDKFPSFSRLPAELRHKIWLLVIPEPRILSLHIHDMYRTFNGVCSRDKLVSVSFSYSILPNLEPSLYGSDTCLWHVAHPLTAAIPKTPSLLHVCHESRLIAMKHYTLAFAGRHGDYCQNYPKFAEEWDKRQLGEKRVWIDFKRDLLFLDILNRGSHNGHLPLSLDILVEFCHSDISQMHRLAIGCGSSGWIYNMMANNLRSAGAMRLFKNLKELIICDAYEKIFMWLRKEGSVEESISEILLEVQKSEGWERELPTITVSREFGRNGTHGGCMLRSRGSRT